MFSNNFVWLVAIICIFVATEVCIQCFPDSVSPLEVGTSNSRAEINNLPYRTLTLVRRAPIGYALNQFSK